MSHAAQTIEERARLALSSGALDEALTLSLEALSAHADQPTLYLLLADVLTALKEPREAAQALAQGAELAYTLAQTQAHSARDSLLLWAAERWEEAAERYVSLDEHQRWRELFERALSIKPTPLKRTLKAAKAFSSIAQHELALKALRPALREHQRSPELHRALGEVYEALGERAKAIQAFSAVCALTPNDASASARVSALLNQRVPTWHFPMMNDAPRNEAFRRAIEARVTPSTRVLDIGSGAGLLSLMSARAGAAAVYACESEPQVAEAAAEIIELNGYDDTIRLIPKRSTSMQVGVDLPERLDLLVCEIFDVSLLGEDALNTIQDAKRRLLTPGAQVLPCGARVWCQPVESDELRARYYVEQPEGFDLRPFNQLRDPRVLQLDLKRFEYTPLTEPILAASFDFEQGFELSGHALLSAELTRSGRVDGFIFWYDLILDHEERYTLSTSPHQEGTHWMQGFAPNYEGQPQLERGDQLSLICAYHRFLLWFQQV